MKLKTKLVIVFMVVMVFPMLFTGVMTRAFVPEKATEIQQMYLSCGISAAAKITESGKEYQRRKSGF